MTALSTRAIAANLILQVLDEGKSLSALIPEVQLSVKAQDCLYYKKFVLACVEYCLA